MADKIDIYREGSDLMQQAEDEICERTLCRLQEYAKVMNIALEKALDDVIPDTRKRLMAHMARKANHTPKGFFPMVRG